MECLFRYKGKKIEHKTITTDGVFNLGDVVIVDRKTTGKTDEIPEPTAGIVQSFMPRADGSLNMFVNHGGIVSLVHENEKIHRVPEDLREIIRLRLEMTEQETWENISGSSGYQMLVQLMEEYNEGYFGQFRKRVRRRLGR